MHGSMRCILCSCLVAGAGSSCVALERAAEPLFQLAGATLEDILGKGAVALVPRSLALAVGHHVEKIIIDEAPLP